MNSLSVSLPTYIPSIFLNIFPPSAPCYTHVLPPSVAHDTHSADAGRRFPTGPILLESASHPTQSALSY